MVGGGWWVMGGGGGEPYFGRIDLEVGGAERREAPAPNREVQRVDIYREGR